MLFNAGLQRELPDEDSTISTNTDDEFLVWTDFGLLNRGTVTYSNKYHFSIHVRPDLKGKITNVISYKKYRAII
jgi:hypothetical protein